MNKPPETHFLDNHSASFGKGTAPAMPDGKTLTGGEVDENDGRAMQHITIHSRSPEEGGGDTLLSATFTTDRHPTGKLRKLAEVAFSRLRIGGTLRIENITVNAGVEGKGVEVMANLPQTAILLIQDELAGRGFYPKNVTLAVNQDQKTMARNILVPIITSSWKRVDEETPGSVATRLPKY